jgi:internalin A
MLLSDQNQIDVKPLANLPNLNYLTLYNNKIRDVKPLASLANLTDINVENNQISDVKPLKI